MIPSHQVAKWLLHNIDRLLDVVGLEHNKNLEEIIYTVAVCGIAILLGWIVRHGILLIASKAVALHHSTIGKELKKRHTLTHCSHIITPIFILCLIPFAFNQGSQILTLIMKLAGVYALVTFAIAINSIFTFIWAHYDEHENTRRLPLRGILNISKGVVWGIVAIISVSIIIERSPTVLLTGLGAFAAALMLIFRNSILGFVAGIQLSLNDMLRVGDWVIVPSTIANGIVVDVSLSVVKIRNWDNTIVMLPPYSLVSSSFQNWRGMTETGFRLIEQAVIIDSSSIKSIDSSFIDKVSSKLPLMKNAINLFPQEMLSTNIGLLRAYATLYLKNNEHIASSQTIVVRLLSQNPDGIPLQIFCYTSTTAWIEFEEIQSTIIEHLIAIAPIFDIIIYNYSKTIIKRMRLPNN